MPNSTERVVTVAALTAIATLAVFVSIASGIIRRHDVDDERYLAHATGIDSVVAVGGGTATLVGERWLLTAAHVAEQVNALSRTVVVGDREYKIDKRVMHPTWLGEASPTSIDVALLRLSEPVDSIAPAPIYERSDEIGRQIRLVGYGMYGNGLDGPDSDDARQRSAENIVDDIAFGHYLTFSFSSPDDPDVLPLEGISGPGDSGGPAFILDGGTYRVAGVSVSNQDDESINGVCTYGSIEIYSRVSTLADWIRDTMHDAARSSADEWEQVKFVSSSPIPDTPAGRAANAFFESWKTNTEQAHRQFEEQYRSRAALGQTSLDDRVASKPHLYAELGPLAPIAYIERGPGEVECVAQRIDGGDWRSLKFVCDPHEPDRLQAIYISAMSHFSP